MLGENWAVPRAKPKTIFRLLQTFLTYRQEGSQHDVDLTHSANVLNVSRIGI